MNTQAASMTASPFEIEVAMDEAAIMLEALTDAGDPVFLWGKPGIGKNDVVEQFGTKTNRKVIIFNAALREPVDLRGIPHANVETRTTEWFVPDELPQVERDGERGILFLDEFNQASQQMQTSLGNLILYGFVGEYHLPKGWIIVAAGNRVSDRASAQRMPTQLRNRFAHVHCVATVEAWAKWANANGVPAVGVAFVRFRDELLHRMPRGDENAFPTPRSLTRAFKYVNVPRAALRQKLMAAHVGADVASEINGFIEIYEAVTSLDDIIAKPETAAVPVERSHLYAVATGLARKATRKNFAAILKYSDRLTGDYPIIIGHDATVRDPDLRNTKAYGDWAVRHQDDLLQAGLN